MVRCVPLTIRGIPKFETTLEIPFSDQQQRGRLGSLIQRNEERRLGAYEKIINLGL